MLKASHFRRKELALEPFERVDRQGGEDDYRYDRREHLRIIGHRAVVGNQIADARSA